MVRLRSSSVIERSKSDEDLEAQEIGGRLSRNREYSPVDVPKVYYKQTNAQVRQKKEDYDYKGNFQDIRHIMVGQDKSFGHGQSL